jgi:hypothetical protein
VLRISGLRQAVNCSPMQRQTHDQSYNSSLLLCLDAVELLALERDPAIGSKPGRSIGSQTVVNRRTEKAATVRSHNGSQARRTFHGRAA